MDNDDLNIKEITEDDNDLIIKVGDKAGSEKGKKGKKARFYAILSVIFFICAIILLSVFIVRKINYDKKQQAFEELNKSAEKTDEIQDDKTENEIKTPETEDVISGNDEEVSKPEEEKMYDVPGLDGLNIPEKDIDITALKEQNEDIYAWILIPDTKIDYPVLMDPEDDDHYLDHNLDGSTGLPGCIYAQAGFNSKDFTDANTVLYGHNMKNGTMFAGLHRFKDKEYFDQNRNIYIFTDDHILVYEIFAAYEFSDDHLLYNYDVSYESGFESYLDTVFSQKDKLGNNFADDVTVDKDSLLLTLETCISTKPDRRFIVQGVLIAAGER